MSDNPPVENSEIKTNSTVFKIGELIRIGDSVFIIRSFGRKALMLECMPGTTFRKLPPTKEVKQPFEHIKEDVVSPIVIK